MIIGFTGTRRQLTEAQRSWLRRYLHDNDDRIDEFHHGACVGADETAHHEARNCGIDVVVHPPDNTRLRMDLDPDAVWLPAKPYLDRDRDIVDSADALIALPDGPERGASGTWYTVRYAARVGVPVTICYPDGTLETR